MKATIKFNGKEYDAVLIEKKAESKRWKPNYQDEYCIVDSFGDICSCIWHNSDADNFRYSQRNVFKTGEEAEKHLEYLKSLAILRDDAGDWEPGWNDNMQNKYYVYIDNSERERCLEVSATVWNKSLDIYFETKEAAQKSIEEHKEHWLRVFGVDND